MSTITSTPNPMTTYAAELRERRNQSQAMTQIDYSRKLRKARTHKVLSQFDVEIICGLPVGTVSRIENNRVNPSKETLLKIAKGLKLSCDETCELFGITEVVGDKAIPTA